MIKLFPFSFFEVSLDFISCSSISIKKNNHCLLVIDGFIARQSCQTLDSLKMMLGFPPRIAMSFLKRSIDICTCWLLSLSEGGHVKKVGKMRATRAFVSLARSY